MAGYKKFAKHLNRTNNIIIPCKYVLATSCCAYSIVHILKHTFIHSMPESAVISLVQLQGPIFVLASTISSHVMYSRTFSYVHVIV